MVVPDPIPMEPVMAAAAQAELGAFLDSTVREKGRRIFRQEADRKVHRFEDGVVIDTKTQGPLAWAYGDLSIYREVSYVQKGIRFTNWRFERGDGQAWSTSSGFDTRSEKTKFNARHRVYAELLMTTCVRQRDAALQRLAEGARLTFGAVELDRTELVGNATVPWVEVTELLVQHPKLIARVRGGGRFLKLQHTMGLVRDIPNLPLLLELSQLSQRQAAGGG